MILGTGIETNYLYFGLKSYICLTALKTRWLLTLLIPPETMLIITYLSVPAVIPVSFEKNIR